MSSLTKIGSTVKPSPSVGRTARISMVLRRMPVPSCAATSRSRWTTKSIEEENTLLTTCSVTFSPAINAALTTASSAPRAELA